MSEQFQPNNNLENPQYTDEQLYNLFFKHILDYILFGYKDDVSLLVRNNLPVLFTHIKNSKTFTSYLSSELNNLQKSLIEKANTNDETLLRLRIQWHQNLDSMLQNDDFNLETLFSTN
jgi:hypothetical protein